MFMTHPEHGATNVGSGEVALLESLGWKVTTEAEWLGAKLKPAEVVAEDQPRRGRPPKAK